MRTYFWDFSADRHGEGTARQYQILLEDFLRDHRLSCEVGVTARPGGGFTTFCRAPVEAWRLIEQALRPERTADD